jgi:phosphoribosylformylglycinamidine (FGAM) synthase PurS component
LKLEEKTTQKGIASGTICWTLVSALIVVKSLVFTQKLPSRQSVEKIAEELLSDRVWESYEVEDQCAMSNRQRAIGNETRTGAWAEGSDCHTVEVAYNPGVTDPVTASALKGIRDMGITEVAEVRTATKYLIRGSLPQAELDLICAKLLVNPTVQHIVEET